MEAEFHVSTNTDNDCNVFFRLCLVSLFLYDNNSTACRRIYYYYYYFYFRKIRRQQALLLFIFFFFVSIIFFVSNIVQRLLNYRRLNDTHLLMVFSPWAAVTRE